MRSTGSATLRRRPPRCSTERTSGNDAGASGLAMYHHLLPQRLVQAVKRRPLLHRAVRRARTAVGGLLPPREFPGIPGRIHPNDFMFDHASPEEVASYAERAGNVIANIEASLAAGGRSFADVERWVDFGCGYGRVIRFLVERNSQALLRVIGDALRPKGIAMLTTHGRRSLENPALYGAQFGERREEIARAVAARGMTFL